MAPSKDGVAQHAIPDTGPERFEASSPHGRDPPNAPEEPPNPIESVEEPMLEFEDLQAHLDALDYRKEEIAKSNTASLKSLNDVLSCVTVLRMRFSGVLEEARRMEQLLHQSQREEAMVAGTAEDGEQDADRDEESSDEEDESSSGEESEKEEEKQSEKHANVDSS